VVHLVHVGDWPGAVCCSPDRMFAAQRSTSENERAPLYTPSACNLSFTADRIILTVRTSK